MDLNEEGGQICRVKGREEGVWGREVLTLMARKLKQFPAPRKIIIYSSSVDGEDSLGEVYHRTVDSQDRKAKRLKNWMDGVAKSGLGEGRVIVATNALGLGIDMPDIRVSFTSGSFGI